MVDLGRQEDWSDYMLIEWAATLELHQRGQGGAAAAGRRDGLLVRGARGIRRGAGLPTSTSVATMEKVVAHLGQTTGDDSLSKLRELLQQVGGTPEPTVQGLVACILKFQGVKLSQSGAATAHSHGHMSVAIDDLTVCTSRIQATVASCLKRIGVVDAT